MHSRYLRLMGSLGALLPVIATADVLPALSPQIPHDVTVTSPVTLESLQADFDLLSWQTFVALNWPVLPDGQPDTSQTIGQQDAPTVWESWKESYQIFLPQGQTPAAWDSPASLPEACENLGEGRLIQQMGKVPDVLDEFIQPFETGPLVDQNGVYTRNDIVVNRSMFDSIVNNGLYSQQGQQQFLANSNNRIAFECGNNQGPVGAIMVKSAWKVLGNGDDPSDFHSVKALVYTPANDDPDKGPILPASCSLQPMGLVGLHIVHKTDNAPQWVWSTFEHVRNVPEQTTPADQRKGPFLFYDANATDRPVNEPPPRPWNPEQTATPSQIVRETPLTAATHQLNQSFQASLQAVNPDSVWANYQLISTQWPTDPAADCISPSPTNPLGTPAPNFLANTTLETYIQGSVPQASSSCMECHNNATTKVTESPRTSFADFTFLLERAQSTGAKE